MERKPPCSLPRAFATSTKLGGSIVLMLTTCFSQNTQPLVKRSLPFSKYSERLRADGKSIYKKLDGEAVRVGWRDALKERGIEAVAILLLHSYRNPAHEIRVKELSA